MTDEQIRELERLIDAAIRWRNSGSGVAEHDLAEAAKAVEHSAARNALPDLLAYVRQLKSVAAFARDVVEAGYDGIEVELLAEQLRDLDEGGG